MQYAIISSTDDPASVNIKESLINLYPFKKADAFEGIPTYELDNITIYTIQSALIHAENLDERIEADIFIFISKHQSKAGIPSLSCHTLGNWSNAEAGGKDSTLCIAPATLLKQAFINLNKLGNNSGFDIVMEVTHHGPYINKPVMFMEVGSTPDQWENKKAATIVATALMETLQPKTQPEPFKIALGIGGLHTCPNFNRLVLDTDIALGHICPKHLLDHLDIAMVKQAVEKTQEQVDFALLDWKGLSGHKEEIIEILKTLNIEIRRTREF